MVEKQTKEIEKEKNSVNYFVNCSFFDNKNEGVKNDDEKKNAFKDSSEKKGSKLNLIKEPDSSRVAPEIA